MRAKVKSEDYILEKLEVEVAGVLWCGARGNRLYPVRRGTPIPATIADAKAIAWDFQSLTSAKLIRTVKTVHQVTETTPLPA